MSLYYYLVVVTFVGTFSATTRTIETVVDHPTLEQMDPNYPFVSLKREAPDFILDLKWKLRESGKLRRR